MRPLTPRQKRFVEEYLVDLNATQAAIRAGFSAKTAEQQGSRLLRNVQVQAAIQGAVATRSEQTGVTAAKVLEHLWDIARADPNDLIQFRRVACRYCWGQGHRWQYTDAEMADRRAAHDKRKDEPGAEVWDADGEFDEGGGTGYDARRDPCGDCPECHGEGEGRAHVQDTRKLTGPARRLFAGVKVTRDGLQVLMRSQDGALGLLFDHLGLGPKRHEVTGKDGGPIKTEDMSAITDLPKDKRDALRLVLKAALGDG